MAVKKTLKYYWDNPKEYKRLTSKDLNNESTIRLLEAIIESMKEEQNAIVDQLWHNPNDEDVRFHAVEIKHDLETDFVEAISFGHQNEMIKQFVQRCPKGVFDVEPKRKNGSVSTVARPVC